MYFSCSLFNSFVMFCFLFIQIIGNVDITILLLSRSDDNYDVDDKNDADDDDIDDDVSGHDNEDVDGDDDDDDDDGNDVSRRRTDDDDGDDVFSLTMISLMAMIMMMIKHAKTMITPMTLVTLQIYFMIKKADLTCGNSASGLV